jgi:hypothetical protein
MAQTTQSSGADRPAASTGSSSSSQQYGQGGSKHCNEMTGTEKQQCLQDEGAKTDSKAEPSAAASGAASGEGSSASGGDTAPDAKDVNETQKND